MELHRNKPFDLSNNDRNLPSKERAKVNFIHGEIKVKCVKVLYWRNELKQFLSDNI